MSDIRTYLKIIKEAEGDIQARAEQAVVDEMKRILANPEDDGSNIYSVYELLDSWADDKEQQQYGSILYKLVEPATAKALFTKATGKLPAEFSREYHRAQHQKAMATLGPQDTKIWKMIADKMTANVSPRDIKYFAWYKISPNKISITWPGNLNVPEAVFGKPSLTKLNITMDDMIKWLQKTGIKQMKRPKFKKPTPSYYD